MRLICAEQRGTIEGYEREVWHLKAERNGTIEQHEAEQEAFDRERREMEAGQACQGEGGSCHRLEEVDGRDYAWGSEVGDRGPTGHGGMYGTCCLFISVRKNIRGRQWQ